MDSLHLGSIMKRTLIDGVQWGELLRHGRGDRELARLLPTVVTSAARRSLPQLFSDHFRSLVFSALHWRLRSCTAFLCVQYQQL